FIQHARYLAVWWNRNVGCRSIVRPTDEIAVRRNRKEIYGCGRRAWINKCQSRPPRWRGSDIAQNEGGLRTRHADRKSGTSLRDVGVGCEPDGTARRSNPDPAGLKLISKAEKRT